MPTKSASSPSEAASSFSVSGAPGAPSITFCVCVVINALIVDSADVDNVKEPLISVAPSSCAFPSTSILVD